MDLDRIREQIMSETGITPEQARAFMAVTTGGMMTAQEIAAGAKMPEDGAKDAADSLVALGAFIEMPEGRYEAMHPRFTVVNMYKRACEARGAAFGRNKAVDAAGAALERPYERARAK